MHRQYLYLFLHLSAFLTATIPPRSSRRRPLALIGLALLLFAAPPPARAGLGPTPSFSKIFSPSTIGPGSVSTLTFTITNPDPTFPLDMLAFTDVLPAGVSIATPANVTSTCGGIVSAPNGGTTISLSGGMLGTSSTCTISVDVTSSTPGTHMNVSGALTSDFGSHGTASADLMVDAALPGFSKSFSPSTVPFGGRSTLTFTIDNTLNPSLASSMTFTDVLPAGMVVATPSNVSNTCVAGGATGGLLTAVPGSGVISLTPDFSDSTAVAAVAAGGTCTITVDVIGGAVGMLGNTSGDLTGSIGFGAFNGGKASAVLTVTGGASEPILLTKEFTDDPVPPGGTVTLRFTITNTDRSNTATGISFTDDLTTALAGLLFTGVTSNTCDATPTGTGTSTISFAGGSLAPESSCTFEVTVSVPGGATQGTFTNTTSTITATINGDPVSGSAASDLLFVVAFPVLTKSFTDDPVGAGGTVTLEFTITNTSTSALSSIAFIDELTDGSGGFPPDPTSGFLPFPVSVTLPPTPDPPCGGGSSLALVSIDTDRQGLSLTGGSLAAAGSPGDSCTFSLTVDVPDGFPGGSYTNFTEEITAVLDDVAGTPTVTGPGASGVLVVEGAPILTKEFTDDPVPPGGTATLVFTLTHDVNATADATAIAFSDDLTTVLAGLTATAVAGNTCTGATVDLSTPTLIAVSGGSLMPGETCTITVTLAVPGSALPGSFTNTTSSVTATVGGVATTGNPASDDLIIAGLTLTKSFTDDPALPGDTVTLRFTLDNSAGTAAASGIFFTDTLSTVLSGLVVVPPLPDTSACGAGSSIVDVGGFLLFSLGSLSAGAPPCSFDVTLMVPAGAADDFYLNVTSSLSATIGTTPLTLGSASDVLEVNSALLGISKSFTDDPAVPGGTVTLEFTIDNLDLARAASAVAFTDDLGAALAGLTINSVLFDDCGGVAGGVGTTMLSYAGGSLAAGGSCTVRLLLDVPAGPVAGGTFTNTTSTVTGTVIGNSGGSFPVSGAAASDDLRVVTLTLDKAFSGTGFPGETVDLTFTLTNLDSSAGASNLSFSDSLPAGLTAVAPLPDTSSCGAGSSISGTSFLTFSGGSLGPSGSCSFTVTLQVPAAATPGTFVNTTSDLFSAGLSVSGPASDALTIEPPPAFTKSFGLNPASVGSISTLTFTIDNSASGVAATGLAFTDVLPAGLVIAAVPNVVDGCGGSVTAAPGASTITYTGGTVAAGAVCTVRVDVTPTAIGSPVNVTGDLTSSSGNSGTATDTLTAIATPITTFTGPTATGAGDATVTISGGGPNCGFQQVAWIALEGDPGSPPAGSAPAGEFFPFGLLDFVLMNCVPGATVDFTLTFPNAFPADADYWKYGPLPSDPTPQWYMLPATFAANVITFSITDGGLGDDDLTADGSITEPGGPAHLAVVPPIDVPTLGSGLLVLLALLLAGLGVARLRRR